MEIIKDYAKTYIKQNNLIGLNPEKLVVITSYGYHKIFHNFDFICHVDSNNSLWQSIFNKAIIDYNNLLKKKITLCLLCITNDDKLMSEYIIDILNKLQFIKVTLIGKNNNLLDFAIKSNTDYIISPKQDYKGMIQNGLGYIKNSNIKNTKILIINTHTLINPTCISQSLNKLTHIYNCIGSDKMKYIDIANNITAYDLVTTDTIIPNWFIINTNLISTLQNCPDIITTLELNKKILKIHDPTCICLNYDKHPKIKQLVKITPYVKLEYDLLISFTSTVNNAKYKNLFDYAQKISLVSEPKIELPVQIISNIKPNIEIDDFKFKNTSIHKTVSTMAPVTTKLFADKLYFINNFIHKSEITSKITKIIGIHNYKYSIIDGNKNRIIGHITAIKDAMTRKHSRIIVIEDKLICDDLFKTLNHPKLYPSIWDLLLIISTNTIDKIIKLNNNDDIIEQISFFAYYLNNTIFKNILDSLLLTNNLHKTIMSSNWNTFAIYDNFNISNIATSKAIKFITTPVQRPHITLPIKEIIADAAQPKQIFQRPTNNSIIVKSNKATQLFQPINIIQNLQMNINTNKIVQSLWIGESLSLNEVLCIMSFINHGHEFHLYTYEHVANIPSECIVKDANEIIASSEIFYYDEKQSVSGQKRPTGFSNMFRYKMLYDKGGYWVDMDMICVKPLKFHEAYVFSSESTFSREQTINAGIIKCPKGSDFAKYCYLTSKTKDKTKLKWGEIGPKLVGEAVMKYNLSQFVKPWYYFCPVGYDKLNDLITPTKLQIDKNWYCIHLWNEFWVKKNWDKNKVYYGSLFGLLVNKYCKKYIADSGFNLEIEYGKVNKSCVIYYWMPKDDQLVSEMESILTTNVEQLYNTDKCRVHKEHADSNTDRVARFINSDIYVHLFVKLLDMGVIDNLHIVFGMAKNDKYVYNDEPLFSNGNFYDYNNKIYLWKLNDMKSLFSFSCAKMYFYKGYGNYEHFYSMLQMISPNSIFLRYLATALPYANKNGNICIDDKWIDTYARNDACKLNTRNFTEYFNAHFTNYDLVYVDTVEKIPYYKKIFTNTKHFMQLDKYSLMTHDENSERPFDLMFCASDVHPSKNWEVFYKFLTYCDSNKKGFKLLIITPVISKDTMSKYTKFRNISVTVKRGLNSAEMNSYYNKCRCLMITFGRDANPRVMTESLSCGCYNIILDILSDGKHVIKNNSILGKLIQIPTRNISYEPSYKSVKCIITNEQHNEMYNLIKQNYDHKLIANTFKNTYNITNTVDTLHKYLKFVELKKQQLVLTLATENYSNNINYLLGSLKQTNPNQMVIVYCVGWRDSLIYTFKSHYPKYQFEEIKLKDYIKGDIIKLKVQVQHDAYFKYKLPFVWIDADSVVLKPLAPIFDKIVSNTLICYYRPEEEYYMKFAVGVIAFGISNDLNIQNTNEEFIKKYYQNTQITKGYNNWFYDQSSLWETFEEYKDKIKLYGLVEKEHSINDTHDTIIYSRRTINKKTLKDILTLNHINIPNIDFEDIKMKY